MKKTIYISETIKSKNKNYKYQCPYISKLGGKWREDIFYFNDPIEFIKKIKLQSLFTGFTIK